MFINILFPQNSYKLFKKVNYKLICLNIANRNVLDNRNTLCVEVKVISLLEDSLFCCRTCGQFSSILLA
jgi:hypothetical protein